MNNSWIGLLNNNATRVIRKHYIRKYGAEARDCPMKKGKRCRPGRCKQARYEDEFDCDEVALSARDLAGMSTTYDFMSKGRTKVWKQKQKGKFRGRQICRAYKMMHIWYSSFCLRCEKKEEDWCALYTNKGATYNAACIHPKRRVR